MLRTVKANYGRTGGEIGMTWREGVFVVDEAETSLDRLAAGSKTVIRCDVAQCVPAIRNGLATRTWADADNWRNWTYRNLRLMRYLIANPPMLQAGDDERGNP